MQTRRAIADQVMAACRAAGTTHVFGMPGGGSNLDVAGSAIAHGLDFVLVHTETAGAIMAAVMGEITGAPGVCVATRGPGAASAINGLAMAYVDRQPMVLVTDCVAEADRPRVSHQRIDQQALLGSVSLASVVLDGRDPSRASDAVALATGFPPGPVHLDLDPTATSLAPLPTPTPARTLDASALADLLTLVAGATRPVIVVGAGAAVASPADRDAIASTLQLIGGTSHVPVLCTYKARGMVADADPWCAGVSTGATIEAPVLQAADLIIGIGLDPVEFIPAAWPYEAPVVLAGSWAISGDDHAHAEHLGAEVAAEVVGSLVELTASVSAALATSHSAWVAGDGQRFRAEAVGRLQSATTPNPRGLTPQQVVTIASAAAPRGAIATTDAGAHMLVAMPLWEVDGPEQVLNSSGYATMGFALPAAIAAALARPATPVVCFTGDGGLGIVLGELETLARLGLPVVVVVFNDATLSLIAVKQNAKGHGGEGAVTYGGSDFAVVARGCGLAAERVDTVADYDRAIRAALASGAPTLLDVVVDPSSYPAILNAVRG
ncbi:MAG: hypothetical protein F2842_03670 [Actinobacteria bacterium]|uniref:Unannotated protein n=1 Tax=freshwater metagenome TaxID=449393 RepID=A0A6J7J5R9_9ZZZZ|nr:hypothetical protein [Actinomycetota bacterium]